MTIHCACGEQFDSGGHRQGEPGMRYRSRGASPSCSAASIFWAVMKGIFIASVATIAIPALLFLSITVLADVISFQSVASMLESRIDGYVGMLMLLNLVLALLGFTVPDILYRKSCK